MFEQQKRILVARAVCVWLAASISGCGDDDAAPDAGTDAGGTAGTHARAGSDAAVHAGKSGSGTGGVGAGGKMAGAGSMSGGKGGSDVGRELVIRFKAKVGDEDFACGRTFGQLGSTHVIATPSDFRFFVQDIVLLTRSGAEVPFSISVRMPHQLSEVAMIDFTDGKGECVGDAAVNTEITGHAADADYDGIVFSNGVPEALNHQNIAVAQPPLQNAGLYWGWLSGYRFVLAALTPLSSGADDAGVDDAGAGIEVTLVHTGSAACTGSNANGFTCSRPNRNRIRLTGFDPTKRAIVADIAKLFEHSDLHHSKQCHGAEPGCDELFSALGVDATTGQPTMTQSVFRVE